MTLKQIYSFIAVFALPGLLMVSCARRNDNNNNNNNGATTPLTTQCLMNPAMCNNSMYSYSQYSQWGFYSYPGGYSMGGMYGQPYGGGMYGGGMYGQPYGGMYGGYGGLGMGSPGLVNSFCNCGSGALPVYNNQAGLGCVQQEVYAPVQGMLGLYALSGANQQWVNITQQSNMPVPAGGQCSQVAQACYPSQPNGGCQSGYRCGTADGAPIGLCIRN